MLDGVMRLIDQVQGAIFENAAQPLLYQFGLMDWSDDVAYSVHDLEDGILAGRIRLGTLADESELAALVEVATRHFGQPPAALADAAEELLAMPAVIDIQSLRAISM